MWFCQDDESDGSEGSDDDDDDDEDDEDDDAMEEDEEDIEEGEEVDQNFRVEVMKVLQQQNALVSVRGSCLFCCQWFVCAVRCMYAYVLAC